MKLDKNSTTDHNCLLGDRGLTGPPGEKPKVPPQMLVEMKGLKGEGGPVGNQGFIGARGVKLKSKFISSFCLSSSALSPLTLAHLTLFQRL